MEFVLIQPVLEAFQQMTQDCYYVYVLLDPRRPGEYRYGRWTFDHEPFYVGKGKGSRARRHFRDYERKSTTQSYNTRKLKRIAAIHAETKGEPIVKAIKNLSEERAYELEAEVVNTIGRNRKGPLLNLTDGGIGGTGVKRQAFTAERSAAMSIAVKNSFATKDVSYWDKRADNVSKAWELKRKTDPEGYAKYRAEVTQRLKDFWATEEGKAIRLRKAEKQREIINARWAAMSDVDRAKFSLKKRLGHLLRRLECSMEKARIKDEIYAFIDRSKHKCPIRFKEAAEKILVAHKLVA